MKNHGDSVIENLSLGLITKKQIQYIKVYSPATHNSLTRISYSKKLLQFTPHVTYLLPIFQPLRLSNSQQLTLFHHDSLIQFLHYRFTHTHIASLETKAIKKFNQLIL